MQVSEQNKQEAEKVITTINAILIYNEGVIVTKHFVIECAIQDRQSVLEELKQLFPLQSYDDELILVRKCKDIIEQIEYLKSKL